MGNGTEARVRASGCARVCDACASLLLRRSLRPTARKASSAWSSLKQRCDPPDPDISFIRTPTGKRSAAQHGTTHEFHEPMKTTVSACKAEDGGPAGPLPLPCRASAMPCPMPCPGPPNGRPPSSALRGLTRHGTGPAVAYRVGQWPPRPCMHSRRVSSARVIPWHFHFVFLVLQHVTGPATLESTSGV